MRKDYNTIYEAAEEFHQFTFDEFCWARMTASSRIFGITIDEKKTDAFVPFADMLNHRRPKQTSWAYDQQRGGFVIEAIEDVNRGDQVFDSYGKKCNSRFFLNYGFIVDNNDGNEVAIKVPPDHSDPLKKPKEEIIKEAMSTKTFRIMGNYEETIVQDFFGHIRFIELRDQQKLVQIMSNFEIHRGNSEGTEANNAYKPTKTPPLSTDNERKMLEVVKSLCEAQRKKYPTTLEDDLVLLKDDSKLTYNQKNCLLLRSGEKEILNFFIGMADVIIPLLDKSLKEVRKLSTQDPYNKYLDYLNNVILPLLTKKEGGN